MLRFIMSLLVRSAIWRAFARKYLAYFSTRVWGWPKLPMSRYFLMRRMAAEKAGEYGFLAFVSVDKHVLNYRLNHALTGCRWGHAGLVYVGASGELQVLHMQNSGLEDDYLVNVMRENDGMALLWFPLRNAEAYASFWVRVAEIKARRDEIEYDYQLDLNGKKTDLYCSELLYVLASGLTVDDLRPSKTHGITAFTPDDLYYAGRVMFDEIY
jgi:hypothetical protein